MTEAAISSNPLRDIYIALGDKFSDDSWVVRIYYKPFIQFIWYGALLMIFGGIFGIFGKNVHHCYLLLLIVLPIKDNLFF